MRNLLRVAAIAAFTPVVLTTACDNKSDVVYVDRPIDRPVDVGAPDADIAAPITATTGDTVQFDGSGSSAVGAATIISQTWDFNRVDGLTADATGEVVEQTFSEAGSYVVTLTVVDSEGREDAATHLVSVSDPVDEEAPVAVAGADATVAQYATLTLDGSGSTDNVEIVEWEWNFDLDGSASVDAATPVAMTSYFEKGTYTVRLTVRDAAGNESTDDLLVTVGDDVDAPTAEIPESLTTAARTPVFFDGSSAADNVGIASYTWTVDGEVVGTQQSVTGSFDTPGTYSGTLALSDFSGNIADFPFTLEVTEAVASSLYARPDAVELRELGAAEAITVNNRYPDGSQLPAVIDTVSSSDDGVVTASTSVDGAVELTSVGDGVATVTITSGAATTTVDVYVGADLLIVTGLQHPNSPAERYMSFNTATLGNVDVGQAMGLGAGKTPSNAEIYDGRAYVVYSGTPGAEGDNGMLAVFEADTLAPVALCDLGAVGAWGVYARTPADVFVGGVGTPDGADEATDSAVVRVNPLDGCTLERVFVPEDDVDVVNGMKRGADLHMIGDYLLISDSGVRADYTYGTPHVRVVDIASFTQVRAIELPGGCVNAWQSFVNGDEMYVGCTGDYGATSGGVAVVSLRTLEAVDFVALDGGFPGAWAFEPFSGYMFAASSFSPPAVVVADIYGGDVVRGFDNPITLSVAPDDPFFADFESVLGMYAAGPDAVYATSFTLDKVFRIDPADVATADDVVALGDATPEPNGRGAQFILPLGLSRDAAVLTDGMATVTVVGGSGDEDVSGIFGPPHGGGSFLSNADLNDLVTVPEGGAVEIVLSGIEIVDGPGPDLVIYENPFYSGGDYFTRSVDPATIQLSPDGVNWFSLPTRVDSAWPEGSFTGDLRRYVSGFVGVEAVFVNPDTNDIPIGASAGGGDMFDIAELGLSNVQAIRIVDVPGDAKQADIDAVAFRNWRSN